MFIINPDPYSLPCYRIGPFQTSDLAINHILPNSDLIDEYLEERFRGKDFIYTENGRKAIHLALASFKLQPDDVVTILTTSGNFYISGCVTTEIEKFCKWSREILTETKVIFVNHEFGYPFKGLPQLREYNLPIIEDCASSFFSMSPDRSIGNIGDYVIYSFPKMFPLQIGGLLVSNRAGKPDIKDQLKDTKLQYIKNVLSAHISFKDKIIDDRLANYNILKNRFESLGFPERFKLDEGVVPGIFMFRTEGSGIDLPELKNYFWAHGIQCSVFYGEEAFFVPLHQALKVEDMDYFLEVFAHFF